MKRVVEHREALKSTADALRDAKEAMLLDLGKLKGQALKGVALEPAEAAKLIKYMEALTKLQDSEGRLASGEQPTVTDARTLVLNIPPAQITEALRNARKKRDDDADGG